MEYSGPSDKSTVGRIRECTTHLDVASSFADACSDSDEDSRDCQDSVSDSSSGGSSVCYA